MLLSDSVYTSLKLQRQSYRGGLSNLAWGNAHIAKGLDGGDGMPPAPAKKTVIDTLPKLYSIS
jgi:hypothetical protein